MKRADDTRHRVTEFWRAVEIFSPPQIPASTPKGRVIDFWQQEYMPWETGSRWQEEPPVGKTWRHQVFGGVYELSRVRDTLTRLFPDDREGEPSPAAGQSALFACTVDETGVLVEGSAVLSSCAWAVGRAAQHPGKLPLAGFEADVASYGDSMGRLVGSSVGAASRLLAASMRGMLPDALAEGAKAAGAGALGDAGGPVAAVAATNAADVTQQVTARILGDGTPPKAGQEGEGGTDGLDASEPARLDLKPLRGEDLQRFTVELANRLSVQDELRPRGVRVRSYLVSVTETADDEDEQSFLNSFYSDDLKRVADALTRNDAGKALTDYLTSSDQASRNERVDVRSHPGVVWQGCQPDRIPVGRWVADKTRPLALSQQFAVNEVMRCLADTTGIFGVNGPPGTGKTTLLRDLVAAIVVTRAQQLAALPTTGAAFDKGKRYTWQTESRRHEITAVSGKVSGMEIVVASTNNGAVANVTTQIPGPDGIGAQWADAAADVDYFGSTARLVHGADAWGMIAARLGNRAFRDEFAELFWWGNPEPRKRAPVPRPDGAMVDALARPGAGSADWRAARAVFRKALRKVQGLAAERQSAASAVQRIPALEQEIESQLAAIAAADAELVQLEEPNLAAEAARRDAATAHRNAADALSRHQGTRPGLVVSLSTGGKAGREWHVSQTELRAALDKATADLAVAQRRTGKTRTAVAAAVARRQKIADRLSELTAELAKRQEHAALAQQRWGAYLPAGPELFTTSPAVPGDDTATAADDGLEERRERTAPWADDAFTTARTELFLAALALHKAFVMAESVTIKKNLSALMDMLKGRGRPGSPACLAVWQTFFLLVPVVSTTFASLPSMFGGLGRESLGWLFIDEAGQVAPQHAVGGIWRAKRVVAVGDPLQLEPVVTLPWGGQNALRKALKVDAEWAPARTSVQRLADQQTTHGTYLPGGPDDGDTGVWVGSPLRVHRRCDHPMIDISNEIAYDGLMVDGVPDDREPFPGGNYWYDVRSAAAEGNWIGAEGERLHWLLTQLRITAVPAAEIRVISPFRHVAKRAAGIYHQVFPDVSQQDRGKWVGTVHTMQGKEADVVILVLGGNPDRPRARTFATSKPNLLNVAVTRARRRLYVIGNHATWGNAPYFQVLARHTTVWPPAEGGVPVHVPATLPVLNWHCGALRRPRPPARRLLQHRSPCTPP